MTDHAELMLGSDLPPEAVVGTRFRIAGSNHLWVVLSVFDGVVAAHYYSKATGFWYYQLFDASFFVPGRPWQAAIEWLPRP